jgi:SH3-like domain-containing protein
VDLNTQAAQLAENIKKTLKIDSRFVVFDFEIAGTDALSELNFRVSSMYAADGIRSFFEEKSPVGNGIKLGTVRLLPDDVPAEALFAICNVSAAPILAAASHANEQITQMILGESADVLEQRGTSWTRVRLHTDGYIGWISTNQIVRCSENEVRAWQKGRRVQSRQVVATLRSAPSPSSDPVREFVCPAVLPVKSRKRNWISLRLPDGTMGWLRASECIPFQPGRASASALLRTARRFLGISYLWGGRSAKGLDCSGFTQMVFGLHGIELPRDASLQFTCGDALLTSPTEWVAGDLVFFSLDGRKITHVGIALGMDQGYIHASGYVKINSFDRAHELFDSHRADTFIGARRLGVL